MEFKGTIWKAANSWVVTIPNDFVKHGAISPDKKYRFNIEEVEDELLHGTAKDAQQY